MYKPRAAENSDAIKIFELYKRVTAATNGLARSHEEVTESYIAQFMQESALNGLEFVIDNPDSPTTIIAEIHCHKYGPKVFDHILGELTIVVDPEFHGKALGKLIFTHLLDFIRQNMPHILRVELIVKESHTNAIRLYEVIGFIKEGKFEKRFCNKDGSYDADIPMVWFNPGMQ